MKLIEPSVVYMPQFEWGNIYSHIERCARTCYKSESSAKEGGAQEFVQRLIDMGHLAMLEHGAVYALVPPDAPKDGGVDWGSVWMIANSPYSRLVYNKETDMNWISTNLRVVIEEDMNNEDFNINDFLYYTCQPGEYHVKRYTMKFVTDIGVVREILRHRKFSFANESTRFCRYASDRFNNELTFIRPQHVLTAEEVQSGSYIDADYECVGLLQAAETAYLDLIKAGWKPEEARCVLPLATKSELIVTGFEDDWTNFFDLRLRGTTGKPHPDMQYLAQLAWNEFKDKLNLEL